MSIWKPAVLGAILGAGLLAAGCQPVGAPLGEERYASKIADVFIGEGLTVQFVRQQVQNLMYQGAITQDQVNQVGIAVNREMEAGLPDVKKTLVANLTKEFNLKELEFLHKLLTSKEGHAVTQKQEAVMQEPMAQLEALARDSTAKAVARINSAWPTGGQPTPPPQPAPQGLPEGLQLPN